MERAPGRIILLLTASVANGVTPWTRSGAVFIQSTWLFKLAACETEATRAHARRKLQASEIDLIDLIGFPQDRRGTSNVDAPPYLHPSSFTSVAFWTTTSTTTISHTTVFCQHGWRYHPRQPHDHLVVGVCVLVDIDSRGAHCRYHSGRLLDLQKACSSRLRASHLCQQPRRVVSLVILNEISYCDKRLIRPDGEQS